MLISCQHENRRVVRQESDGTISVIDDKFEGKLFNSPNEKPIGSSSDKRVDNTKLYINILILRKRILI